MKHETFTQLIGDIFTYFNRKHPDTRQLELWFDEVQHIPDLAVPEIYKFITQNEKPPTNLPMAMKTGWSVWQKMNPGKIVRIYNNCTDCQDKGVLWLRKRDHAHLWVCRCGGCNNWERHFGASTNIPRRLRSECEAEGLIVWPLKDPGDWKPTRETTEQMAKRVAENAELPF